MMGSVRRLLALLLAHLTATVVAVLALAIRRFATYDVPLPQSLTPVRFLPHLLLGPVYAIGSLIRLLDGDALSDKRFIESVGYLAPLVVCYLIYTWLLVGRRRRPIAEGFTPVVRDRFPEENAPM
jgi:hypothetical protein